MGGPGNFRGFGVSMDRVALASWLVSCPKPLVRSGSVLGQDHCGGPGLEKKRCGFSGTVQGADKGRDQRIREHMSLLKR